MAVFFDKEHTMSEKFGVILEGIPKERKEARVICVFSWDQFVAFHPVTKHERPTMIRLVGGTSFALDHTMKECIEMLPDYLHKVR